MSSPGSHQDVLEYILTQLSAEKPDGSTRWWIQAEVLASVADFWANFRTEPNPGITDLCGKILDHAKQNYLSAIRSKDADQLWFDDYGWWGLAFAKLAVFGKDELKGLVDSNELTKLAVDCAQANAVGKSVWAKATPEQRKDPEFARRGPPAVAVPVLNGDGYGGLWNANYQMLQHSIGQGWDTSVVAIQNTVTNANYLLLCLSLAELLGEGDDGPWTREVKVAAQWLHAWINPDEPRASEATVPKGYLGTNGLIRERVPSMPDFGPDGYWAGDQGIWLAVLSWLWEKESALRASLTDYLTRLLQNLPMDSDGKRPLNDANLPAAAPSGSDPTDYATGREVLIRHLTEALVRFKTLAGKGDSNAVTMLRNIKGCPPLVHVGAWRSDLKWPPVSKFEFSAAGAHLAVVVANTVMSRQS